MPMNCPDNHNLFSPARLLVIGLIGPLLALFAAGETVAEPVSVQNLMVEGDDSLPGYNGYYLANSGYSWMSHTFAGNTSGFSWTLGPGTDGGILLWRGQPTAGEMIGVRPMFNQPTTFYTVNEGITVDAAGTLNVANLRMQHRGDVYDVGGGSGFDTSVGLIANVGTLADGVNGWQLNTDGSYHIIYNTTSICPGCKLKLHFFGQHIEADGDINQDGQINAADVLISQAALLHRIEFNQTQKLHADIAPQVNGIAQPDGIFDITDLLHILQKAR